MSEQGGAAVTTTTGKSITDSIIVGSKLQRCYSFLFDNYKPRFNIITGNLEDGNQILNHQAIVIDDREVNTMFLQLSVKPEKDPISKDYLYAMLQSKFVPMYNPFLDFFEQHKNFKRSADLITKLAKTINTDTPNAEKYIKHWGCGMIASIYGSQSPLTLVLAGEVINTGKTEWFRRLLPDQLKVYYAESTLDGGKDDDILMCKKLIIMDDEFGGKSKKDQRHFKGMTSKQNISVRVPYGKSHVEMRRMCSLAGTSNELELLSDSYGNRRILPINVKSIDHQLYNSIDKVGLFMAFYDLYKSGFHWKFTSKDIIELNAASDNFHATNPESELISEFFEVPVSESDGEYMTNTVIKDFLETRTKQKIWNPTKLGIELKNLGFKQKQKKMDKVNHRMYLVRRKNEPTPGQLPFTAAPVQSEKTRETQQEDLPF